MFFWSDYFDQVISSTSQQTWLQFLVQGKEPIYFICIVLIIRTRLFFYSRLLVHFLICNLLWFNSPKGQCFRCCSVVFGTGYLVFNCSKLQSLLFTSCIFWSPDGFYNVCGMKLIFLSCLFEGQEKCLSKQCFVWHFVSDTSKTKKAVL